MLGMCLYQGLEQRQYLDHAQKLELKQLLLLEQRLKDPVDRSDVTHGLDGMLIAHQILKGYEASGLLIGGLSEAV